MILPSRPDLIIQSGFEAFPSFLMQDYNSLNVRTYIDHAILKGGVILANVDLVSD